MSGLCFTHSHDLDALRDIVKAQLSQNGNGQTSGATEKRGRGRVPKSPEVKQAELAKRRTEFEGKVRQLGNSLLPSQITRAVIADEYTGNGGEVLDDSTITKWVAEFYGRGVSVPFAVNRILTESRTNAGFDRENKSVI